MKILKGVLYTVGLLGALVAFGWFFASQLSSGSGRSGEPAGVLLSPPSGYAVVERGELSPSAAAAELEAQDRQLQKTHTSNILRRVDSVLLGGLQLGGTVRARARQGYSHLERRSP